MARVVPAVLDRGDTPSPGERLLFNFLRDAPATADWLVLHSQRLATVQGKVQGEADFVICVPDLGVLVLEVKAHKVIRRSEGQWLYGPNQTPGKDPFQQASGAMHSLKKSFDKQAPMLRGKVLFASAVAFTHVDSIPSTEEWLPSQVIDATAMTPSAFCAAVKKSLTHAAEHLFSATGFVPSDATGSPLSRAFLPALEDVFRPRFEAILNPSTLKKLHEEELLRLTSEQYSALDEMNNNDRVVFEGPAGTGKTLLAIEAARRAIDVGDRVLFICHNKGLAEYLRTALRDRLREGTYVGTVHAYLTKLTGLSTPVSSEANTEFFTDTLPRHTLELMTRDVNAGGFDVESNGFDTLIIDELQDLATDTYLEIIPNLLRNRDGRESRVFAFGDIENQAFFDKRDPSVIRKLLKIRLGGCSFRNLTINCRNPRETVKLVQSLMDVRPPYSAVRRHFEEFVPEYKVIQKDPEQELVNLLHSLESKGYIQTGVTVLSLAPESESSATRVKDEMWRCRLVPLWKPQTKKSVTCTSVYQFKGLESPIVILTDIEHINIDENVEALYVGLTRSTLMTFLIVDKSTANHIASKLLDQELRRAGTQS